MIDLAVNSRIIHDVGLVIFDKDGTLIELYTYWAQMVALRAKIICETLGLSTEHQAGLRWALGVDEESGRLRPEGPVGLKKREIVLKAATDYLDGIGLRDTLPLCEKAFDRADEISTGSLRQFIRPIQGAVSLMGALHDRGCRVALATVDVGRRARLAMEFMGVSDTLDLIVGGEEVARGKPDPEMIHIILDRLGIGSSKAVMVGDALSDVQMGINAGLKASIGVLTGFATAEQLRTLTSFIARDVSVITVRPSKAFQ
ncbi:MAG: HAD family hydrolase [Chloroflexi bacterium]|jgi:phosphoglycolate phosphatase|nr:HAD family hydrolase [Chloroflexota bacterium]